ncbi:MAG: phosphoribosylamine--glycine ligase [Patescibacteria group bacterium]|nr:phosphoribosylamine--glycine ligase [Patescibacteria group bacterium]
MSERIKSALIIGDGGREHAIGWKIHRDGNYNHLYFAPGNGGTNEIGENIDVEPTDIDRIVDFSVDAGVELVAVGPEAPLAKGVVDALDEAGVAAFGPKSDAALLESSKAWATRFMRRHNIPHPETHIFRDPEKAISHIRHLPYELVVKADGLASGKGVFVTDTHGEAVDAIKRLMIERELGSAGRNVVVQKKEKGQEVSIMAFTDGETVVPLLPAQDHKRIFEDYAKGPNPNTGGMGAYAPVPNRIISLEMLQQIQGEILEPTVRGMREEGNEYKGVLYAGLMLTPEGPKVLEYNVRFGDPETQPEMIMLSSNLPKIMQSCVDGNLRESMVRFRNGSAVCVVLASEGYPENPITGILINGVDQIQNGEIVIFHGGTRPVSNRRLATSSGRALGVTAYGATLKQAVDNTYSAIGEPHGIYFEGMQYRKDIGSKAFRK